MLPAGLPFSSVGGSSFGNEPSTFGALLGFFSFGGQDLVDSEAASGRQACLVHNQRTNFPALFTIGISSGFYVTEYSAKSRTEVSVGRALALYDPSLAVFCRLFFSTMLPIWKVCRCSSWRQFDRSLAAAVSRSWSGLSATGRRSAFHVFARFLTRKIAATSSYNQIWWEKK
jgi:hypothetical protein